MIHRDVKPGNILIDTTGQPHLAAESFELKRLDDSDFGTRAQTRRNSILHEPRTGTRRGTSGRWALRHLQPGRGPLRAPDRPTTLSRQFVAGTFGTDYNDRSPSSPSRSTTRVPKELERIGFKAMSKRAPERYSTARDMADDLQMFLHTTEAAIAHATTSAPGNALGAELATQELALLDRPMPGMSPTRISDRFGLCRRACGPSMSTTPTSSSNSCLGPAIEMDCPRGSGSGSPGLKRSTPIRLSGWG